MMRNMVNEENKKYEKPEMYFVEVRSNHTVANTCWGGASGANGGGKWYYNTSGAGYVAFTINASSCKEATTDNVVITYEKGDGGSVKDQDAAKAELLSVITNGFVNNAGSPYKGENVDVFTTPDDNWS